jgi:hypothetical protein
MSTHAALVFIRLKPSPETVLEGALALRHFESTRLLMTALAGIVNADSHGRVSLELASVNEQVSYIIGVPELSLEAVAAQLYAAFSSAELEVLDEWSVFDAPGSLSGASVTFSPPGGDLKSSEFAGSDPLRPILETLQNTPADSRLCVQLILSGAMTQAPLGALLMGAVQSSMTSALRLAVGGPATHTKPEPTHDDKHADAPFHASLRIIGLAPTDTQAVALVTRAANAYHQLSIPGKTQLRYHIPGRLSSWLEHALLRIPDHKTSFALTINEAANLYHTPLSVRTLPSLVALETTRLPVPHDLPQLGITLGYAAYRDSQAAVKLSPADRLRHMYLIGQTGTGKSSLFQTAILQDMENGDGCCFIDPHGDVIDWLLPRIPAHRAGDVILFDPSDPQSVLGLNLLEWRTPAERDLLIQELIVLFYKLFDPGHTGIIGPQFEHWLRNAALTITEPNVRGSLTDIPRLFTDSAYKDAAVARSEHAAVKDFWNNQMAATADFHKSEMLNYFTSKFGSFLGNSVMHQILSQRTSAFDLRTIMDRRKILLVNLSKGKLGSLNAQLLGTLIMTKIQMAAMSRADVTADQRPPFYVYIDEFQNVVSDSFAAMLSEIRKYGVGLHLAHQYVDQLPDTIKQAVFGNIGTIMAFRLGQADAKWLAPQFAPLAPEDLTNIAPYQFHLRTLAGGQLTTPFTVRSPLAKTTPQPAIEQAIRRRVRTFAARAATKAISA